MAVVQSNGASSARGAGETFQMLVRRAFATLGGVANVLGVYAFGESHGWWHLPIVISATLAREMWMLAVGVGGPWAMILGSWAATKAVLANRYDTISTMRVIKPMFNVGSFFAIYHCAQMSFGYIIFPKYLNASGFAMVSGIYVPIGLAYGLTMALLENYSARQRSAAEV
jgi:hypothetical protein